MAIYRIIAWRGIPATVEARDASGNVSRPLSERFQMLIDSVAMQLGLAESDEYLEQWSGGEEQERAGAALEVADAVAAELEERFPEFVAGAFRTA
jgi:Virulence factor